MAEQEKNAMMSSESTDSSAEVSVDANTVAAEFELVHPDLLSDVEGAMDNVRKIERRKAQIDVDMGECEEKAEQLRSEIAELQRELVLTESRKSNLAAEKKELRICKRSTLEAISRIALEQAMASEDDGDDVEEQDLSADNTVVPLFGDDGSTRSISIDTSSLDFAEVSKNSDDEVLRVSGMPDIPARPRRRPNRKGIRG